MPHDNSFYGTSQSQTNLYFVNFYNINNPIKIPFGIPPVFKKLISTSSLEKLVYKKKNYIPLFGA